MAERFALVSVGVLCLMLSALVGFHIGGQSAHAQGGMIVGYSIDGGGAYQYVIDSNGGVWRQNVETVDVVACNGSTIGVAAFCDKPPNYVGNFWTGGSQPPVGTDAQTWGRTKQSYGGKK